jgi:hypothetical protein
LFCYLFYRFLFILNKNLFIVNNNIFTVQTKLKVHVKLVYFAYHLFFWYFNMMIFTNHKPLLWYILAFQIMLGQESPSSIIISFLSIHIYICMHIKLVLLLLEFLLFRFYAFKWFICWKEYKRAERWRSGWHEEYKTYMAWMFPGTTIIEMWWCRQQSKLTDVIQPWTTSIYFFTLNYSITFIEFIQLLLNFRSHFFLLLTY